MPGHHLERSVVLSTFAAAGVTRRPLLAARNPGGAATAIGAFQAALLVPMRSRFRELVPVA